MNDVNEFDRILVMDDLQKRGITRYDIYPGNQCVWVNYYQGSHSLNDYYIIRHGRIVDIVTD